MLFCKLPALPSEILQIAHPAVRELCFNRHSALWLLAFRIPGATSKPAYRTGWARSLVGLSNCHANKKGEISHFSHLFALHPNRTGIADFLCRRLPRRSNFCQKTASGVEKQYRTPKVGAHCAVPLRLKLSDRRPNMRSLSIVEHK